MERRARTAAAVLAGLLLAACGAQDDAGGAGAGDDPLATVATADTDLGEVLVSDDGATLYLFDSDPEDGSACTDACAETWPPLPGPVEAGDGADAALVGTIERPDGTTQTTYAGHPVYRYAADGGPGDVEGQGVGGVWWVLAPDGSAIRETAPAATTGAESPAY